jgi:hypothetical protein
MIAVGTLEGPPSTFVALAWRPVNATVAGIDQEIVG